LRNFEKSLDVRLGFRVKSGTAHADRTMTMQKITHQPPTYLPETAMWDSPCPEATFVASRRGNVWALDRRHAG
jgi:hypothetical protein